MNGWVSRMGEHNNLQRQVAGSASGSGGTHTHTALTGGWCGVVADHAPLATARKTPGAVFQLKPSESPGTLQTIPNPYMLTDHQAELRPGHLLTLKPPKPWHCHVATDHKAELRRLTPELLFMMLELLRTLVERPQQYAQQLTSVNVLLSNLIHLANLLRPRQVRVHRRRIRDRACGAPRLCLVSWACVLCACVTCVCVWGKGHRKPSPPGTWPAAACRAQQPLPCCLLPVVQPNKPERGTGAG